MRLSLTTLVPASLSCLIAFSPQANTRHDLHYLHILSKKRELGSSHQAAIRALAFKWIRIIYGSWKDHKPYNEVRYLRSLKERGSPLLD